MVDYFSNTVTTAFKLELKRKEKVPVGAGVAVVVVGEKKKSTIIMNQTEKYVNSPEKE